MPYLVSQFTGCLCSTAIVFGLRDFELDTDRERDSWLFFTHVFNMQNNESAFFNILIASSLFIILYFAVTDNRFERVDNMKTFRKGLSLGISVFVIKVALSNGVSSIFINPSQDFSGRIFCQIAP
eukprot:UN05305